MTARIALVGAAGHGVWHRRSIGSLAGARLVAVCDVRPVEPADGAPLDGVEIFTDHRELLAGAHPDVVVVFTPPHTHLAIALDVIAAGADLLLEKPPVAGLDEHDELTAALAAAGRKCQVNFQALGAAALDRFVDAVRGDDGKPGVVGEVTAIGASGAWWRPPSYWRRSSWAGRRWLDGRPVVDGALGNPFAHAVMQGLAVAEELGLGAPVAVEVERYRAGDIEVEDTGGVRVEFSSGRRLTVAVTLASCEFVDGRVQVSGSGRHATLEYPTDRVHLPGADPVEVDGRVGMLDNLLAHRADQDLVPLRAPLARTRTFTEVLSAVLAAPPPVPVPSEFLVPHEGGWAIEGVAGVVGDAAATGRLLSETGAPWASGRPHRVPMGPSTGG